MKYRIVIEWVATGAKTFGKYKYKTPEVSLQIAKRIQAEDYPDVLTWVEDENGQRYDHNLGGSDVDNKKDV